ncbi:glycosyltransferase [Metabacillus idriensis]|uniref:glycosyltransferase n=1 Tax=Metabacillus idriensis TaxID=324768 RepID=UPI003D2C824A
MKTIVYYISEYGYGHATRSIALIRELMNQSEVRVVICNSFAMDFIKDSVHECGERIVYHRVSTDVGYILKEQSLDIDTAALSEACRYYLKTLPGVVSAEAAFLRDYDVDLIISDISPLAFEVAERLQVPSLGISNFTWHTAYKNVINQELLAAFADSYDKMDYFFSLAGSAEPQWGVKDNQSFGFFSRRVNKAEVTKIRDSLDPRGGKHLVFLPIGMKINLGDITNLPLWERENCVFVVSSNMTIDHPNVHKIPSSYTEVQNYVAAADLVISKAGWGTISEAAGNGTSLTIINRPGMEEDQNTIAFLKDHRFCSLITWEDLYDLNIEEHIKKERLEHLNEVGLLAEGVIDILETEANAEKEGL